MKIIISESQLSQIVEKFKIEPDDRLKIYESDNFLMVVPLTHTASCKYGAGTKWCVTEKDPDMFEKHFDMGSMGFLIVKNPELRNLLFNDKFAFYVNRSSSQPKDVNFERIIVYDDANRVISMNGFLNVSDQAGVFSEVKTAMTKFMEYANEKFKPGDKERIKKGLRNPFIQ